MSGRYVVIVNGRRSQFERFSFAETIERVVQAHERGERWDLRRATGGAGYRPLTKVEGATVVAAVRDRLVPVNDDPS